MRTFKTVVWRNTITCTQDELRTAHAFCEKHGYQIKSKTAEGPDTDRTFHIVAEREAVGKGKCHSFRFYTPFGSDSDDLLKAELLFKLALRLSKLMKIDSQSSVKLSMSFSKTGDEQKFLRLWGNAWGSDLGDPADTLDKWMENLPEEEEEE
jgi:hypothetical protein